MDKELLELRSYNNLFQEREVRASEELNSIISQRNDEIFQLSSKMSALQEKNSVMQSELTSLELKLSTAVSERSAKEETIATINEVSKKRVCELKAELETATKSNSEFQKEFQLKLETYELMQEDNTSSVLEELEESKNRTKALEEILDNVECEGNTLTHRSDLLMYNCSLQKIN